MPTEAEKYGECIVMITVRMLMEHLKEDIQEAELEIERDKRSIKLLEVTFGV
jgi:hypothetical protein